MVGLTINIYFFCVLAKMTIQSEVQKYEFIVKKENLRST